MSDTAPRHFCVRGRGVVPTSSLSPVIPTSGLDDFDHHAAYPPGALEEHGKLPAEAHSYYRREDGTLARVSSWTGFVQILSADRNDWVHVSNADFARLTLQMGLDWDKIAELETPS